MAGPEPIPGHPTPGTHIWGWMTPEELDWLGAQAASMDSVVEIGSLHGRSAFALLTACPGTVYCIDPWNDEGDHCYPSFLGNCGHFPNLVAVRGFSPQAGVDIPAVDMVFIDGDHTYDAVIADIEAWLPRTRRLMCGHDYNNTDGFPDVKRAVHDVFGGRATGAPLAGWGDDSSIWVVEL